MAAVFSSAQAVQQAEVEPAQFGNGAAAAQSMPPTQAQSSPMTTSGNLQSQPTSKIGPQVPHRLQSTGKPGNASLPLPPQPTATALPITFGASSRTSGQQGPHVVWQTPPSQMMAYPQPVALGHAQYMVAGGQAAPQMGTYPPTVTGEESAT